MLKAILTAALAAAVMGIATPALADWTDPNVEGAKEHPLLSFYPEARVDQFNERRFDAIEIVTGYQAGAEPSAKVEEIEGRITEYTFQHKPEVSALEVARNMEAALKKKGAVEIMFGKGAKLPAINGVSEDDRFGAYRFERDGQTTAYINFNATPASDYTWTKVVIVEPKVMEQVYEITSTMLYDDLSKSGRVAVYGINFETGKTAILPDSAKVLDEVRKLLAEHEELSLAIEGHTDNVGSAAANQKLSEGRADAVRDWLVANGIAATRLSTAGFGDTMPATENDTEEGRAKNRRVELVRK